MTATTDARIRAGTTTTQAVATGILTAIKARALPTLVVAGSLVTIREVVGTLAMNKAAAGTPETIKAAAGVPAMTKVATTGTRMAINGPISTNLGAMATIGTREPTKVAGTMTTRAATMPTGLVTRIRAQTGLLATTVEALDQTKGETRAIGDRTLRALVGRQENNLIAGIRMTTLVQTNRGAVERLRTRMRTLAGIDGRNHASGYEAI